MSEPTRPLRLVHDGRVARVELDRPPLHILDLAMLAALEEAFAELATARDLQFVAIAATGEKAFSAGVSVQDHTGDKIERMLVSFHRALVALRRLDALTVALVDGPCLGGGMELALCCDLVYATERSKLGQPEIQLGCFPPVAAALYPRRIGSGRTLELLLSGRTLSAAEAAAFGFVDRMVADRTALEAADRALESAVTARSAAVTRLTKRAVRAGENRTFESALAEAERIYLRDLVATGDMSEGISAFLEKRPPRWSHS